MNEYTDYSKLAIFINDKNLQEKADTLMEQYARTASISPYNVAMVPLGDDFRYDHKIEWDQQYKNYEKLIGFINAHKDRYHGAQVHFSTPSKFFEELRRRSNNQFPTLRGDFFVYSDVSAHRPVYWSGYFTSRPYWKVLDRELEANLRSAEILYTFAINSAKKKQDKKSSKLLDMQYKKLTTARQNLALFQHHDAITGTSREFVMNDYGLKLFEGIQGCASIQTYAIQCLMSKNTDENPESSTKIIVPDSDRQTYDRLSTKQILKIDKDQPRNIVVFNSHGKKKTEPIKVLVTEPNVQVVDIDGLVVKQQINPVWNNKTEKEPLAMSNTTFELFFVAILEPLSLTVFTIRTSSYQDLATVYCKNCAGNSLFNIKQIDDSVNIQMDNDHLRATFNGKTGLLSSILDKSTGKLRKISIDFTAYVPVMGNSGAYLFKPDTAEAEKMVLEQNPSTIVIISGPLSSEITVFYNLLVHTVRLYHRGKDVENNGLYVENIVDFGPPPKNKETELVMRLASDVDNGNPAVIYTDSNGFQMQKRVTTRQIGLEGNYFPVTSTAYIEDGKHRLTVLVNHAQGVAGWEPGRIELMLDRRTVYDDGKGMSQGVTDSKKTLTKYCILLETVSADNGFSEDHLTNPSLVANLLSEGLLYPANVFFVEPRMEHVVKPKLRLINKAMTCDCHLMNFRSVTESSIHQFSSQSSLMVLQRKGYDCRVNRGYTIPNCHLRRDDGIFSPSTELSGFDNVQIAKTTLTGIRNLETVGDFDLVQMAPMDLSVFNVTFVY